MANIGQDVKEVEFEPFPSSVPEPEVEEQPEIVEVPEMEPVPA